MIAKAKAAGLKLTSELVHQVRDSAKAAGAAKRTAAEKKVAVSATKASASSKTPKRKSLPAKTVTKKVMKQATAVGRKLASVVKDVRATTTRATAKRKDTAAVAETPAPIPIGDADVALASPKPRAWRVTTRSPRPRICGGWVEVNPRALTLRIGRQRNAN